MTRQIRRVAVYCGSASPENPRYEELAMEIGDALARQGIGVVYGGGKLGLMGAVAAGALLAGGEVIGVIPESPGVLSASNAGVPVILDDTSPAGQAYEDAVARLAGETRPMRFLDAQKKGFLARLFGS